MKKLTTADPSAVLPGEVAFKNREVFLGLSSVHKGDLSTTLIAVTWPNGTNGALEKVALGKNTIYYRVEPGPVAIIDSGWTGPKRKRTLRAGQSETLRFTFENDRIENPHLFRYTFVVTFSDGTDLSITTGPEMPDRLSGCEM